jgi:Predicted permeases
MNLLQALHLSSLQWILAVCCALLVGFSKTAITGVSTLAIPIMAGIFGGKSSAAILLPMLITGDLLAVRQYRRHNNWGHIWRLLPWTIAGLIIGVTMGNMVNDHQFKMIIAFSVLICLALMVWLEWRKSETSTPDSWWFTALIGLAGGFTTMIGNAAGPVMTIYFLAIQLNKYDFVSTGAWFFMILNLTKVPLQVIFWGAITPSTLAFDATMIPAIVLGALLGLRVIRWLPEKPFRYIVIVLAVVAAVKLFF